MLHQGLRARAQKIEQDAKRMRVLEEAIRWLSQYQSRKDLYAHFRVLVEFCHGSECSGEPEANAVIQEFLLDQWPEAHNAILERVRAERADLCEKYGVTEAESDAG